MFILNCRPLIELTALVFLAILDMKSMLNRFTKHDLTAV